MTLEQIIAGMRQRGKPARAFYLGLSEAERSEYCAYLRELTRLKKLVKSRRLVIAAELERLRAENAKMSLRLRGGGVAAAAPCLEVLAHGHIQYAED